MKSVSLKLYFITLSIWLCITCVGVFGAILLTKHETIKETGIMSSDFFNIESQVKYIQGFENKYSSFIDNEKAEYICRLCNDFEVDSDIVIAILERENPTLVINATSKPNENGTRDLGLFQLNDRSLYRENGFISNWWLDDFGEFNADNWKHNAYIAVKYVQDLTKTFGNNVYYIAAGYNAGIGRAYKSYINNDTDLLPESTAIYYAPIVINNYKKWKEIS